ncbi:MAG: hypothetical protein KH281_01135 [Lachnospiraceae bacterium]|nr:hypothetical protein [Lachnospiraceae bacterium]
MGLFKKIFGARQVEEAEEIIKEKPTVERADWDKIVCPYCFQVFSHKDVHFRSMTVKNSVMADEAIEERWGDDEIKMRQELDKNRIARKFQKQREDPELSEFWARFHITPAQRDDAEWNYPVIRPSDKEMLYHGGAEGEGLIYSDGFLTRVKDCYSEDSTVRLCPKCHNKLPSTYGKYKALFISVVGITGSGKTVYLNQLLESLQKHLSCAGLVTAQTFNLRPNERIAKNSFLPMSTQEGVLYPPMMINIIPNGGQRGRDETTLVFYDIAGENCIDTDRLYRFGPYLQKSQAIIMLMDPKQFKQFDEAAGDNPVSNVVEALINFFDTSGTTQRPLMAATLSKSDKLREMVDDFTMDDFIQQDSVIFKKIQWNSAKKGFYKNSYQQMMGAMISLMKELDPEEMIQGQLKKFFHETAFFAVSALGVEVQPMYNIGTDSDPLYIDLTKETEQAIQLLKKEHRHGPVQEPPLYKGRKQVLLGKHPDSGEEVIQTFEEIRLSDKHIEYWLNENPDPYRIEEPLLWVLYRLNVINGVDA